MNGLVIVTFFVLGYVIVGAIWGKRARGQEANANERFEPFDSMTGTRPLFGGREWYELLGVPAFSTTDEIEAAYRRQMDAYDPEKISVLAPGPRRLAEHNSREIRAAYEYAMNEGRLRE